MKEKDSLKCERKQRGGDMERSRFLMTYDTIKTPMCIGINWDWEKGHLPLPQPSLEVARSHRGIQSMQSDPPLFGMNVVVRFQPPLQTLLYPFSPPSTPFSRMSFRNWRNSHLKLSTHSVAFSVSMRIEKISKIILRIVFSMDCNRTVKRSEQGELSCSSWVFQLAK